VGSRLGGRLGREPSQLIAHSVASRSARTSAVCAARMANMSSSPEPRAEVVEDLYVAIRERDDELLATAQAAIPGPTAAEWDEATELLVADKISEILDRRPWSLACPPMSWPGSANSTTTCHPGRKPSTTASTAPTLPRHRTALTITDD